MKNFRKITDVKACRKKHIKIVRYMSLFSNESDNGRLFLLNKN